MARLGLIKKGELMLNMILYQVTNRRTIFLLISVCTFNKFNTIKFRIYSKIISISLKSTEHQYEQSRLKKDRKLAHLASAKI